MDTLKIEKPAHIEKYVQVYVSTDRVSSDSMPERVELDGSEYNVSYSAMVRNGHKVGGKRLKGDHWRLTLREANTKKSSNAKNK